MFEQLSHGRRHFLGLTALSLAGTVTAAIGLASASAWLSGALPQRIRTISVRIAGSWIAASAIMVLALRLAV